MVEIGLVELYQRQRRMSKATQSITLTLTGGEWLEATPDEELALRLRGGALVDYLERKGFQVPFGKGSADILDQIPVECQALAEEIAAKIVDLYQPALAWRGSNHEPT